MDETGIYTDAYLREKVGQSTPEAAGAAAEAAACGDYYYRYYSTMSEEDKKLLRRLPPRVDDLGELVEKYFGDVHPDYAYSFADEIIKLRDMQILLKRMRTQDGHSAPGNSDAKKRRVTPTTIEQYPIGDLMCNTCSALQDASYNVEKDIFAIETSATDIRKYAYGMDRSKIVLSINGQKKKFDHIDMIYNILRHVNELCEVLKSVKHTMYKINNINNN